MGRLANEYYREKSFYRRLDGSGLSLFDPRLKSHEIAVLPIVR